MHLTRVANHVVELPADVFAVLVRCLAAGRGPAEVIALLARGRIDVDDIAYAALHKARAAVVEEVPLGVRAARRTTNETGVGARARHRLGRNELKSATKLFGGLRGHQRLATDPRGATRGGAATGVTRGSRTRARIASVPASGMLASPPMRGAEEAWVDFE